MEIISFISENADMLLEYLGSTFVLVSISIIVSILLWLPVGLYISKDKKFEKFVVGVSGIIFCIPSLALFTVLITVPGLGISRKTAVVALVLYAMMPLVKSVYQGINSVPPHIVEAAKGMGMNKKQILKEVELPLATPVIFAGLRVVIVMITGLSTIAAYIGERNLGRLITQGLQKQDMVMILVGALSISIIAIILDNLMSRIENNLKVSISHVGGKQKSKEKLI